jgi:hypothetical protein
MVSFNVIAASNGTFCLVGDSGVLFCSTDHDDTWIVPSLAPGIAWDLDAICWYGSRFCAVGASGSVVVSRDESGAPWTLHSTGTTQTLTSIACH